MLIVIAQGPTNTLSTALVQCQCHTSYSQFDHDNSLSNPPLQERDHPDKDFYQNSSWTHSLIYFMITNAVGYTTVFLVWGGMTKGKLLQAVIPWNPIFLTFFPVYIASSILTLTMLFILLEDINYTQGDVLKSFMGITRERCIIGCKAFLLSSNLVGSFAPYFGPIPENTRLYCLCANAAVYCALSITVYFTIVRHGYAFL